MKKIAIFNALFSCFATFRSFADSRTKGTTKLPLPSRRLRLESLEDRQLLSANPANLDSFDHSENFAAYIAPESSASSVDTIQAQTTNLTSSSIDVFNLSSKPDSPYVVYLDFDGHVGTGSYWNGVVTPRFALDGNTSKNYFTAEEKQAVYEIWQIVAEDYLPFNVNVTTVDPGDSVLSSSGSIRACIGGDNSWYGSGASGVAYIGSFSWDDSTPCYIFSDNCINNASRGNTASHEIGHTFGLGHDGSSSSEYYTGNSEWSPIMGTSDKPLVQWSKGEYYDANNQEDDVAVIASVVGYRNDDYSDSLTQAYPIPLINDSGNVSGVIGRATDKDCFSFKSSGNDLNIFVGGTPGVTNLDVLVTVYDSAGKLVATYDPYDDLAVSFTFSKPAGTYYLTVDGTGKETDVAGIYSDYGSLGAYDVTIVPVGYIFVTTPLDVVDANDGLLSLREAIADAQEDSVIRFSPKVFASGSEIVLDPSLGRLVIDKGITIDADEFYDEANQKPGITINANRTSSTANGQVFLITADSASVSVSLVGLTLTGGNVAGDGGAILTSSSLSLKKCLLTNNKASGLGGGVASTTASTTVYMERSSMIRNQASLGGAVGLSAKLASLTFVQCYVAGNTANQGGSVYCNWSCGVITATNSLFIGNYAKYAGGVFRSYGQVKSYNSTFVGNYAQTGGVFYNWGGQDAVFNNSILAGNVAESGSEIYTVGKTTTLNYSFISNSDAGGGVATVVSTGSVVGGTKITPASLFLKVPASITVQNVGLDFNSEEWDLRLSKTSPVLNKGSNSLLTAGMTADFAGNARIDNNVVDMGAYEYQYKETPSVVVTTNRDLVDSTDGVISLREAISYAGTNGLGNVVTFAASLAGKTIVLNGSQLVVNKAITIDATSLKAAGITIDAGGKSTVLNVSGGTSNSPVRLKNLTLTGGKTAWYGGLLYTKDVVSVQNCKFNAGFAYYGGAIANEGTLTVENSSFNDNQGSHGGAMFNRSTGMLTLSGITATINSATNYGGVLYNNGTSTITDSEFQTNSSKNRAGAIYVAAGTVSVAGSTFVDNTAANFGGTIYNAGTFDVSTSSITGGSAIYGGAIANFKTLTVTSCDLTNNSATKQGGAIYHSSSIAVTLTAGSISGNSAYQGGGLYVRIGTVRLTGTELKSNSVTHNGGAIYSRNQTILTDCVVTDNNAKYYGGGVYNEKIVRLNGTTTVADNATETGKSPNIHTKDGGQVIVSAELANSVFDETDWLIEL